MIEILAPLSKFYDAVFSPPLPPTCKNPVFPPRPFATRFDTLVKVICFVVQCGTAGSDGVPAERRSLLIAELEKMRQRVTRLHEPPRRGTGVHLGQSQSVPSKTRVPTSAIFFGDLADDAGDRRDSHPLAPPIHGDSPSIRASRFAWLSKLITGDNPLNLVGRMTLGNGYHRPADSDERRDDGWQ